MPLSLGRPHKGLYLKEINLPAYIHMYILEDDHLKDDPKHIMVHGPIFTAEEKIG